MDGKRYTDMNYELGIMNKGDEEPSAASHRYRRVLGFCPGLEVDILAASPIILNSLFLIPNS